VLDIKSSGPDGFDFLILNAGMEANTRPLLYGSRHPFYVISTRGELLSSEFDLESATNSLNAVVVGRCCESGDSQTLDDHGHVLPRKLGNPRPGDYVVIGGTGAYCSSMTLINYNSYLQAPEVLLHSDGETSLIRKPQTFEQIVVNELPHPRLTLPA
jgi:diaminopimelate decarboxylase